MTLQMRLQYSSGQCVLRKEVTVFDLHGRILMDGELKADQTMNITWFQLAGRAFIGLSTAGAGRASLSGTSVERSNHF